MGDLLVRSPIQPKIFSTNRCSCRHFMKTYQSLFRQHSAQKNTEVFAHFYPINQDFDEPFRLIASATVDTFDAWTFKQPRFKSKHSNSSVPKLKNYLNYTFIRLLDLERSASGRHFRYSSDQDWVAFNTGLQNANGSDILATFQRYKPRATNPSDTVEQTNYPDWVFKGCYAPIDRTYRDHFGTDIPEIAWYSKDSRDFVFNIEYQLEKDLFDHLFERAKERAGMPNAADEVVRNYLRGAIENLIPKIRRNYKVAIPVYYVEEKRMQLLLPFYAANYSTQNPSEISCFLVERDDGNQTYRMKTIFDLDQAYFSARLITRPDMEWLNP